ncbi:MAG TPA: flagellar basal body P-ring formation chaperone FlgA [Patescibacteria group bacterium]|nr:flagellar basal body P-ring formation chaperone FlgA [Patescibacteria group bacterium]
MGRLVLLLLLMLFLSGPLVLAAPDSAGRPVGQMASGQQMADIAQVYLQQQVSVPEGEIVVTPMSVPSDLLVPAGAITYEADLPYGVRQGLPVIVQVTVSVNGKPFTIRQLRFDVKAYQQVVIATRLLSQGEIISAGNIRLDRRDVSHLAAGYITDEKKIMGLAVRRVVVPGTVLTTAMLGKPLMIHKGQAVTLLIRTNGIEVSVAGTALQDGSEGQMIRVQNNTSKKAVTGQVLDTNTVLL